VGSGLDQEARISGDTSSPPRGLPDREALILVGGFRVHVAATSTADDVALKHLLDLPKRLIDGGSTGGTMRDAISAPHARRVLASFGDYAGAQATVDRLADRGFPIENVSIVGWNVRIEEQVTGRMTDWRAAGYGAASGAWFGLLVGLLIGLFAPGAVWLWFLLLGVVLGALWGALFGFLGHWVLRGRRDFESVQKLAAERWDVTVPPELLLRAQSEIGSSSTPRPSSG
jgi:hypothetical protein